MNLKNIVIVLSRPEESRNVGAVCRAMANNGIGTLRIVGHQEDFDDTKVRILALHSAPLWEGAHFFSSITEATSDCTVVAGTTRRRGKNRKGKLLLPHEFAAQAAPLTESNARVAVVFGNERTGLTDGEMRECTEGVTIPSCADFASLNLSHAVQIICYELFKEPQKDFLGYTPIALSRLNKTVEIISGNLQKIGFFSRTGKDAMEQFWREILSRAALSEGEATYIEHIFDKAAGLAGKHGL